MEFQQEPEFKIRMENSDTFDTKYGESISQQNNYNDLKNKPTLDGRVIVGNISEQDPTVPDWAKAPKRPEYSAEDVGAVPAGAVLGIGDLEYMWDTTN